MRGPSVDHAADRLSSSQDLFDSSWRRQNQVQLKPCYASQLLNRLVFNSSVFQTFRHRVAHLSGPPCFLKPGCSEPPLDYTQSLRQTGVVAGGWAPYSAFILPESSLAMERGLMTRAMPTISSKVTLPVCLTGNLKWEKRSVCLFAHLPCN